MLPEMFSGFTELIPGLPEELAIDCLARLHYTSHRLAGRVCRRWRDLLRSRDFYYHRKRTGQTHKTACLVQAIPVQPGSGEPILDGKPSYGVSIFDPDVRIWDRIDPIPKYPNGLPLFCQLASSEGKLLVMGGWDPESWAPLKDVFVYEFTDRRWTRCTDMPASRSLFAAGSVGDRVVIAGGHDENKTALSSAWVYSTRTGEWTGLEGMGEERDECEGVVIGSEFWVVSGYETESQGRFKGSAEALDLRSGRWRPVQGAWAEGQCPRSCVGVGKSGNLISWADCDPNVRVGSCSVDLGDRTLVTGSASYRDAPQGFIMVEKNGGQNGKFEKLDVPSEFLGCVQSSCCIEI